MEILEALEAFGAEGRPFWKPMHMQPIFRNHAFVTEDGERRRRDTFYDKMLVPMDNGAHLFSQCVCLPSDIKMTEEEQDAVMDIVAACFDGCRIP